MIQGEDKLQGDVLIHESKNSMRICINIKEDYRAAGVIEENVYSYLISYDMDKTIKIGAYNNNGKFIRTLGEEYLLLPAFTILLANEMQENEEMAKLFLEYIDKPAVDLFVNIHEDFYQNHKFEEHNIIYEDISTDSLEEYTSIKESYKVIGENKNALKEDITITINRFSQNDFDIESQKLIPNLGPEFSLPRELQGVSNAIQSGDILATMNFGYFGTKELNQALYNRFNSIVEVASLSDEAIKRMLTYRTPECMDFVDNMISVYHKIKKKIELEELDLRKRTLHRCLQKLLMLDYSLLMKIKPILME